MRRSGLASAALIVRCPQMKYRFGAASAVLAGGLVMSVRPLAAPCDRSPCRGLFVTLAFLP